MDIAKELNKLSLEYLAHDNTKNVYTTEVITKYISYDKDLVDEHRDEINGTLIKLLRILEQEYNAKFIADTISNGDFEYSKDQVPYPFLYFVLHEHWRSFSHFVLLKFPFL